MKTFPHLFNKLFCQPLMVLDSTRVVFERQLLQRLQLRGPAASDEYDDGDQRAEESPVSRQQRRVSAILQTYGSVAVITINGVIDKKLTEFEMSCYGGVDLDDVNAAIIAVANDPMIEAVVFDINSPGGSVTGVPETAHRIRQLGAYKNAGGYAKETRAFVDGMACSAAFYLASQCDVIDITPTAVIGSIGVYTALLDESRALEMEGYKVEFIKAGRLKGMGASFKPLTAEERDLFQAEVSRLWEDFKDAVRSGRGTVGAKGEGVSDEVMQGQCFRGPLALEAGLCDSLINKTRDEYLAGLLIR